MKHQPLYQDKVNAKLATHGVNFRIYIRRGLIKIAEERGESLPEETRPAVESYGTAEPRFEPSMSPVKAPTTGDDASDYKQRLARLQQMFGQLKTGGDQVCTNDHVFDSGLRTPNSHPAQENTNAVNAPVHVEPAAPTEDPSKTVNALKERLARMRSTMTSAVDQDAE